MNAPIADRAHVVLKKPRVGDSIVYIAGDCEVMAVMDHGQRLKIDAKYRGVELVERAADGHWLVLRAGAAKIAA